jgi:hypothetical protein
MDKCRVSSVAEQLIRKEPPAAPTKTQHDANPDNPTQPLCTGAAACNGLRWNLGGTTPARSRGGQNEGGVMTHRTIVLDVRLGFRKPWRRVDLR